MKKYFEDYKTEIEKDYDGNKLEDVYIMLKHKGQIYRYNDTILVAYIPSIQRGNNYIKQLNDKIIRFEQGDKETRIYFSEEYIHEFCEVCKAYTKGKGIKTWNKRKPKDKIDDGKKYTYEVLVKGEIYKANMNMLEANILIGKLKIECFENVTRRKVEVKEVN